MQPDIPFRRPGAVRRSALSTLAVAALPAALLLAQVVTRAAEPAPPAPGVPEAMAKVQAGDPAAAIAILKEVTAKEPANARAWRALGYASLKAKDGDAAIAAYQRSLALEPEFPQAMYNLAVGYAFKGDRDNAFAWLQKTAATHKVDMTQIEADADLASLKDDARFRALLPTPEVFAHPFVEPAVVLREWDGEAMNDQFGWIARNIGDVDGDGANDVVTSAPTKEIGGTPAGRIYVYSSRSGRLLWTADGQPDDQVGTGVEGAGDTNRDGTRDVVAGAPGGGRAYVYSGRDGKVLRTFEAENRKDDSFGRHASAAGDVDHDGYADVIVGAPGNNTGGQGAGRAYVYSGKTGRALLTLTGERAGDGFGSTVAGWADAHKLFLIVGAPAAGPSKHGRTYVYDALGAKPKFVIEADDTGNALGMMFVSVLGDVDGDRVPDIYASDWSNGAGGARTGRIYVHSGKSGRRLLTLTGETAGEGFGIGPAAAGDVDGDGRADLIVGAWQYAGAAVSGGRATLYSGKDGRAMKTWTCKVPGDTFGFDAVGMGDVDGDGTIDLLVTSAWSSIHGYHSGRVFLLSSGIRTRGGEAR
ncbi:MAG TPA: FG-GAP-like repeat-containing protein [Candidatus Polarisedimenticolia bacterium]|nr:FG-GAP-like repeat-containing protein [Candidatus Polarisedimenticolia bacterium]